MSPSESSMTENVNNSKCYEILVKKKKKKVKRTCPFFNEIHKNSYGGKKNLTFKLRLV